MYGEHIGTLNVSVDEHTVFLLSGNQGNKWKYFRTHLSGVGNKEVNIFSGFVDFSTQYCLFDSISHCGNEKCEGFKMLKRKATVTLIKNKSN